MEDNPYQAPEIFTSVGRKRKPTSFPVGVAAAVSIVFAGLIVVVIISSFIILFFVDIRENPRYWDEMARRQKMGMTADEAAESIRQDQEAGRWPQCLIPAHSPK